MSPQQAEGIAVVGLAVRTAGAATPAQLWKLLRDGDEAVSTFTDAQLRAAGLDDAALCDPAWVRSRPVLDDIDRFDPAEFGLTPHEAALTDPQLRLLLECAGEALESAAVDPARFDGAISVFAGTGPETYYTEHLLPRQRHDPAARIDHLIGNSKDFVASRLAWSLGLRGPAVNVQAGCATSLVAIHLAAQSLLSGESDLALAGGATIYVPQHTGYRYREGGINSPDGRCRAFSANADGTTPGDGVAVLALRRLDDALADGDPILGVLEATAVNNDGAGKAGFAAPNAQAQADVLAEALSVAGLRADDLDYIEAHGTGTALGDEIEMTALAEGIEGLVHEQTHRIWIGTHKPNIGDTWAAAGALGVAKVLLSLSQAELPPSINSEPLNPRIDFASTPFAVNTELRGWTRRADGSPRRAGVHVFGLGGTNVHAIVAEPPQRDTGVPARPAELLTLSARSDDQLRELRSDLADYLAAHPGTDLRAVAWTLQSGRRARPVRAAYVVTDIADAVRALRDNAPSTVVSGSVAPAAARLDALGPAEYRTALAALAAAWVAGDDIDLAVLRGDPTPVRLDLPGHPYRRTRCWIERPTPAAESTHSGEEAGIADAPTPVAVAAVWAAEFGFDRVDVDDEFFDIGGHSLLAARIVDRLRQLFEVPLSVRELLVDAPTPTGLAALIDARITAVAGPVAPLPAHRPGEPVPLSAAQRRMWLFMQLYPGTAAYNVGFPMRVRGTVDPVALRRACGNLVARHAALRTRFVVRDGQPVAVVDAPDAMPDLVTVRDRDDTLSAAGWIAAKDAEGFDLSAGPLVRLAFAPGDTETGPHLMLLCAHHTVVDGMSLALLHAELAEFYAAETESRAARLPEPVVQFPDLMLRAATAERAEARRAALEYWRDVLPARPAALDLPFDHPRPEVPTFAGSARMFTVTPAASARLRAWARGRRAGTFAVVTAAVMTVLHRITGQTDITLGTVTHGRVDPLEHGVVGSFADTALLHRNVLPDTVFGSLVEAIRDSVVDALTHQAVGLDEIARELGWDTASATRMPMPQAMVIGQQPVTTMPMGALELEPIVDRVDTARFDLVVNFWEDEGVIRGAVTGALDVFAEPTIAHLAEMVATTLEAVAANTESPVGEITVVPESHQRLLREDWTGAGHPDSAQVSVTGIPRRRPPVLHELVLRAAHREPDAVAVTAEGEQLTYGELLASSERLARRLIDAGVQPEQVVAVFLPRGIDYVIALVGILRAGAAFVPVDTGWPEARRSQVLTQARVALAVGTGPGLAELRMATVDLHDEREPGTHRLPDVAPEQVAYVMFTSGSTGVPKGVMIRHGAIGYRLQWQRELLEFGPGDGVLFKAPLGFDISINEIFLPLCVGARLAIAAPGREADIGHLLEVIERDRVTFFYVVASMLDLLLDRPDCTARARSLRYVWCGGEALTDTLYRRFADAFPDAVMMHGYGPAEATIGVSCRRYTPARQAGGGQVAVTIGRPNPGARVYVLDTRLRPAPIGVVGELYIGGLPLGRGYLNAPGRTAEAFVADVISGLPGSRLYRTGDLASFNADGELVFCGRADHQVKVHGYRVELGELEAVTVRHPEVRRAAFILDDEGELAAFYQPAAAASLPPHGLREWLRATVPAYMVPRSITVLDTIPMTTAGKIDRAALAGRIVDPVPADQVHAAPRGATETALAGIWRDVLGVETVGVDRNFFELGGHSMALIRVQNLIARELGVEVALLELFEHTTIGRLAAYLDAGNRGPGTSATVQADDAVESARRRADAARAARQRAAARRQGSR